MSTSRPTPQDPLPLEETLRRGEEWFRLATTAGRVGVWDWDVQANRVIWSDVVYEIHGVEPGGFGGTVEDFAALVHPDDRSRVRAAIDRALDTDDSYEIEFRVVRRGDRQVTWIFTQAAVIRDAAGTPTRLLGATTDVTARRQAEQALRESEERFHSLAENAPVLIWITESDGQCSWVNQPLLDFVGRSLEEERGRGWMANLHPEGRERVMRIIERAYVEREPFSVEYRLRRHDGEYRWILDNGIPRFTGEGEFAGYIGSCVDITQQKANETALQRHIRELQTIYGLSAALARADAVDEIVDAALDGLLESVEADRASVLLFDADGVMRFKGWRGLSAAYRGAVDGHSPWRPEDTDAAPFGIADVATDPSVEELRETIMGEGIRALAFIPLISGGRVIGKFMVYYDAPHPFSEEEMQVCQTIAGQVVYAIERARAEQALRESNRRKDEFLAVLGHELRNPLAPLRNMLDVVAAGGADPELRERAWRTMDRQVDHLVRLVDDLLDVSRISRGVIRLQPTRIELGELVGHAVEDFRPVCRGRSQALELALPDRPLHLMADPTRLTQVVENLLNNASKFTDPGGRIHVEVAPEGPAAVIRVRDDGVGIDPDRLSRIFEPFSTRSGDTEAEAQPGAGLGIGLSLVSSLVELHEGTIEARSEGVGRGSEFIVRLPVAAPSAVNGQSPRARSPGESSSARASAAAATEAVVEGAPPRRVLVVDDNRDAAETLAVLLDLQGHEVRLAFDGPEALEAAADFRPEVILLDLGLPKMSGLDVARRMREETPRSGPLIVAVTGWSQDDDRRRSEAAGFDAHLVKPLDIAQLTRLLAELSAS